jgi:hypothetical protein
MTWLKKKCVVVSAVLLNVGMVSDPFGKIIHYHDNVLVSITGWRMESHEIYAPFTKGVEL